MIPSASAGMKRELDVQCEPPNGSLEAPAQSQRSSSDGEAVTTTEEINVCSKRFRVATKVNGYIVYTRVKKKSRASSSSEIDNVAEGEGDDSQDRRIRSLDEILPIDSTSHEEKPLVALGRDAIVDKSNFNAGWRKGGMSVVKEEDIVYEGRYWRIKRSRELKAAAASAVAAKARSNKAVRRVHTRSTCKLKETPVVEVKVNGVDAIDRETVSSVDVEMIAEGTALSPPKKNLELKMSKKISLETVPMTVRELFETGLLEGVPVVYMGGKKFEEYALRGYIKDVGILCTCSYCNGRKVIPPSQFEIHAIRQYRRAAQYICFENGKSLLDVLNICRYSPLDSLEATIQSAISGLPVQKTFTCKRCKGTFPSVCVGRIGPLCNSCAPPKESLGRSTVKNSMRASSAEPILMLESSRTASVSTSSQDSSPRKIKKKSLKSDLIVRSPNSAQVRMSSRKKSQWKITLKPSKFDLGTTPSESDSMHLSSRKKKKMKITPRSEISASVAKSLRNELVGVSSQNKHQWKLTTKDQRLHKLVFEDGGLPDGTEVAYYARGQKLLLGYKRGFGILCRCCNCEVSPSTFEAHAGWATRKKPYAYIYTSNGVSLHELAISLSKGRKYSARDNDDLCIVCADGGNLVLCDGCPRAFHKGCASLPSVPRGDWYCQFCQNMFQRQKFVEYNANAVAAGRIPGIDPIEQITKRCIRIVKNVEAELTGCVLCRGYDFSRSGFGPRTIILCDQCEKEFHVGCLRSHKIANLKELPKGKWFCCMDCNRIHSTLQKLLVREAETLPDDLLNVIKKKQEEKGLEAANDIDLRWRLLSGKIGSGETKLLLSQALNIFQECFDPIFDATIGRDLIPLMVYGKNSKGQDYGGMYCAVLTVNSRVVSAGLLRIFGQQVAELPLVATGIENHGKGYFQLLFSCIEKLLAFLNVQSLVLPAAEEAESIWTDRFGFQKIKPEQLGKYRKSCYQMVTFKGTSMLQKTVPTCRIVNQSTEL